MSKETAKDVKKSQVEEVKPVEDVKETEPTENDYSPFLYIYSQGCGWCKKSEPIVDELNNGIVDSKFPVPWENFKNTLLVTNSEGLNRISTRIYKIIKLG